MNVRNVSILWKPMTVGKACLLALIALVVLAAVYFAYMDWAFPEDGSRTSNPVHLTSPEGMEGDCYTCHVKATPKVAQDWYDSKHGVILVRCQICHGMPDGKGALPFTIKPDIIVCARCHTPAMQVMEAKYGKIEDCYKCHPNHQNPMHGDVYEFREATTKTEF